MTFEELLAAIPDGVPDLVFISPDELNRWSYDAIAYFNSLDPNLLPPSPEIIGRHLAKLLRTRLRTTNAIEPSPATLAEHFKRALGPDVTADIAQHVDRWCLVVCYFLSEEK